MLQNDTILVIAPDLAARTSLRFLLEAEGYKTAVYEGVAGLQPEIDGCACMVVDEKALGRSAAALKTLAECGRPMVVLVDPAKGIAYPPDIFCIQKPLLGNSVLEAVSRVVALAPEAQDRSST